MVVEIAKVDLRTALTRQTQKGEELGRHLPAGISTWKSISAM
jgi:hypothetical protein